jgi:hypothetical protein
MTNIGRYVERVAGCIMSPICEGLIFYEIARIQPDKLTPEPDQYMFLDYGLIKGIEVKNFSFIQKKVQKVRISYGDKAKMFLLGNVAEKSIPYQAENFAKFCAKYKK